MIIKLYDIVSGVRCIFDRNKGSIFEFIKIILFRCEFGWKCEKNVLGINRSIWSVWKWERKVCLW